MRMDRITILTTFERRHNDFCMRLSFDNCVNVGYNMVLFIVLSADKF